MMVRPEGVGVDDMEQIINGLKYDTEKARISRSRWEADLAWQEKNPGGRRIAFWHPESPADGVNSSNA
jgi:hypothetical protein